MRNSFTRIAMFSVLVFFIFAPLTGTDKRPNPLPESFTQKIETLQKEWRVPGMAVGIIKDNKVIFSRGFGYRDIAGKQPVTPQTLFRIGSCTKAFTATAIAQQVDKKKLEWEEAIIKKIPGFKLHDQWATQEANITDLLAHRSGLGRHDLLTHGACLNAEEIRQRLPKIPLSQPFRGDFRYSNLNYILAAAITQKVTGKSWTELVRQNIFQPLGMSQSCFTLTEMKKNNNHAKPYSRNFKDFNGPLSSLTLEGCNISPASGGIISNLEEMLNWLKLNLQAGTFNGKQVVSPAGFRRLIAPVSGFSYSPTKPSTASGYGMGWYVYFYRGRYLVQHTGIMGGYCSIVSFMPKENIAVVVLTNLKMHSLPTILNYFIYDTLLNLEPHNFNAHYRKAWNNIESYFQRESKKLISRQIKNTRYSQPLSAYAGRYHHPAYGSLEVKLQGKELQAIINGAVSLPLSHYHYDVWLTIHKTSIEFDNLTMQFLMDANGKITGVAIDHDSLMDRTVFTRGTVD